LIAKKGLRKIGTHLVVGLSGESKFPVYEGNRLAVGEFVVPAPLFEGTSLTNALGLGFLSRFTVTFDFPGRRMLLSRGEAYARPDDREKSGLILWPRGGTVVVEWVNDESPAKKAGFKKGDILIRLVDLTAAETSFSKLCATKSNAGRIDCLVRRGRENVRLTMHVPE
jgi:hypothetical protein